jgi:outer membrane lipoprotein-sorting protein
MTVDSRSNRPLRILASVAAILSLAGLAIAQPASEKPATDAPAAQPAAKPETAKPDKPKADPNLPAGKDVVAKFIDATGGKAAYEKIKSRRATGNVEITAMGMKGTVSIISAAPNSMRFHMDLPGAGESEQATDGKDVWSNNSTTGPSLAEGEERDQFLVSSIFNPELRLEDIYASVDTTSMDKVDGDDCYVVEFTPKKGSPETRYYSKNSKLLVKTATVAKTPMGEITTEVAPGDWKEVDGVKQPHSMSMKQMGMEMKVTFDKIEQNVDLPADTFAMPAEIKALKDKGAAEAKPEGEKKPEPAAEKKDDKKPDAPK